MLQSVYSRRWKNTAVYGASQVQTTICCILLAITVVTPQNIGLWLWKGPFALARRVCEPCRAAKTVQIRADRPGVPLLNSPSKPSPDPKREQGAGLVQFIDSTCANVGNRVEISQSPG